MYSGNNYINMQAKNNVFGLRLCIQLLQDQRDELDVAVR